jgi:hypothetical protein
MLQRDGVVMVEMKVLVMMMMVMCNIPRFYRILGGNFCFCFDCID